MKSVTVLIVSLHAILKVIRRVFVEEDPLETLFREDTLIIINKAEELLSLIFFSMLCKVMSLSLWNINPTK